MSTSTDAPATEQARKVARWLPLKNPQFRCIWLSGLISGLGDWGSRIALSVLLFHRSNSAMLTAMIAATAIVPWVGPGQWFVKKLAAFAHVRVMVVSDLVRAILWLVASFQLPTPYLLALLLVAEFATVPFASRRSLAARSAVDARQLPAAVAILNNTFQLTVVLGYLAGAASLVASPSVALRFNAITFVISALLLRKLTQNTIVRNATERTREPAVKHSVRVASHGHRLTAFLCSSIALFAMGLEALIVPFLLKGHVSQIWTGVAIAAVPLSTIAATLFAARWDDPKKNTKIAAHIGLTVSLFGGFLSALGVVPVFVASILLALAAGTAFACASSLSAEILAKLPTDGSSAVLFSAFQGAMNVSQAIGALGIGFFADRAGMNVTATGGALLCALCLAATMMKFSGRATNARNLSDRLELPQAA